MIRSLRAVVALSVVAASFAASAALGPVAGASDTTTVVAAADARIHEWEPTRIVEPGGPLRAKSLPGGERVRSYVKFAVPAVVDVEQVVLRLMPTTPGDIRITVNRTGNDWSPSTLTWANAPAMGSWIASTPESTPAHQWLDIDVTTAVTPGQDNSFVIAGGSGSWIRASEHTASPPQLIITTDPSGGPVGDDTIDVTVGAAPSATEGMRIGTTPHRITANGTNDAAVARAKALHRDIGDVQVQAMMGFGALNPWPRESGAKNWHSLDNRIDAIIEAGDEPAIALFGAPDWMKYPDDAPLPANASATKWSGPCFTLLNPSDDAPISASSPNQTGATASLAARNSGSEKKSYLKFDVLGDDRSIVQSARLVLKPRTTSYGQVTVHETSSGWSESSISWNNAPSRGAYLGYGQVNASNQISIDLDPSTITVGSDNSFVLSGNGDFTFDSKGMAAPPELHLTYRAGTAPECVYVPPHPDHYDEFAQLAKSVAQRYQSRGVTKYVVWIEVKGFWSRDLNAYNYIEYTNLYNRVWHQVKSVSGAMQVGGPYLVIHGTGSVGMPTANGPVTMLHARKDPLIESDVQFLTYWAQHKAGADFVALDRKLAQQTDDWVYTRDQEMSLTPLYGSVTNDAIDLIRSAEQAVGINNPASSKVWWVESYFRCDPDEMYMAAGLASMLGHQMNAGSAVSLRWSPERQMGKSNAMCDPNVVTNQAQLTMNKADQLQNLWSSTDLAGGGQPYPAYYVYRDFAHHFGPNRHIFPTTVTRNGQSVAEVEAFASGSATMLVNKSATPQPVRVEGQTITLGRYEVRFVPR